MLPLGLALFSRVSTRATLAQVPPDGFWPWVGAELAAGHVPSTEILSTVGALLA